MALIFSCCLYGVDPRYSQPLLANDLKAIELFLEVECIFRVYCNIDVSRATLTALSAHGYDVQVLCFQNINLGAMFVRYLPILESDDEAVFVRDADCCYSRRELELIKEWLKSNFEFHIIRGHPLHIYPIMGGLFSIRGQAKEYFRWMLNSVGDEVKSSAYNADQIFLAKYIYPELYKKALVHTVRVAFSKENYIHYESSASFIGETIVIDGKRAREKEIAVKKKTLLIFPQAVSVFIRNRFFAKIVSIFSVGL